MGVRFCLICVKTVVLLPFLWHPQPGLWPPRLEGGCTPEPCAKLQWWFWCQGVWRRGLSSHLPLFLGSPEEGGQGVPPLDPWQAQPAEGCPTTLRTLCVVHRQVGAVLLSSSTWNSGVHCPHQTNKTPGECSSWWSRTNRQLWGDWHLPGAVELYSSPPKTHTMETLCSYCACQHHKARWKWPQWRCHGEKKLRVCTSEQAEPHISYTQRNKQLFRNLCSTITKETFFCHKIRVF